MAQGTSISWAGSTWNCITGCTPISSGCANCYAKRMTRRLQKMQRQPKYAAGFDQVVCHTGCLEEPYGFTSGKTVFVNSMGDTFHKDVRIAFLREMFLVMNELPELTFLVLTKRPDRMARLADKLPWSDNIWAGTTIEDAAYVDRADHLRNVPAKVLFLSVEPLLGNLTNLNLDDVGWLIAGGESGPGARPCDVDAVRDLRDQAVARDIPFHFKQWGTLSSNPDSFDPTAKENGGDAKGGRTLDGKVWAEFPLAEGRDQVARNDA